MKLTKKQKKLFISTSVVTTLGTTIITPLVVQQTNILINNENLLNNQTRAITNSGFSINSDNTINIATEGNTQVQDSVTNITNPNIVKTIPNGYVIPMGELGVKNLLVCLANDNPKNILWYSDFGANTEILATEYMPINDSLIVLYRDGQNINNGITTGTNIEIKVKIFNSISNVSNGISTNGSTTKTIASYTYDGTNKNFSRSDLWTLSPIYYHNAAADKILIYNKHWYAESEQKFFVFNIKDNTITETPVIDTNDNEETYLSLAAIQFDNDYYYVTAKAVKQNETNTKIVLNIGSFNLINSSAFTYIQGTEIRTDSKLFSRDDYLDVIKTSVSTGGIITNNDAASPRFSLLINTPCLGNLSYRAPFIISVNWNRKLNSTESENKIYPLFNTTIDYNNEVELFNAQFINAPVLKNGTNFSNGKGISPLIGNGFSGGLLDSDSGNGSGMFTFILKHPAYSGGSVIINDELDSEWIRIYPYAKTIEYANKSNVKEYTPLWETIDNLDNKNVFSITQYSDTGEALSDPWKFNFLQGISGSNKALIINPNDRGQAVSVATYGYYSTLTKNTFDISDSEHIHINDVTANYLIEKFNLNKVWNETQLVQDNPGSFSNFRSDSIITINPNTINKQFTQGSLTVDLWATSRYTSTGELNITDLESLKNNWEQTNHKIATITINGFEPGSHEITTIKSTDWNMRTGTQFYGITNSHFININAVTPSDLGSEFTLYKTQITTPNGKKATLEQVVKRMIWERVCNGEYFTNLAKIPTINDDTWESDFNSFFITFRASSRSRNSRDIFSELPESERPYSAYLTYDIVINKEYVYTSLENQNFSSQINIWGFRANLDTTLENAELTNENWSNINIPGEGNSLNIIPYQNVTILTEDELKQYILDQLLSSYDASEENNYANPGTDKLAHYLPYVLSLDQQGIIDPSKAQKIAKDNIVISDYKFYAAIGKMSFTISLNTWQGNSESSNSNKTGSGGPSAKWTIFGFRKDNVTSSITQEGLSAIWDLSSYEQNGLKISEIWASDAANGTNQSTILRKAIVQEGVKRGYFKIPFWVDFTNTNNNEVWGKDWDNLSIIYNKEVSSNDSKGIAVFKISFATFNYQIQDDGSVTNVGANDSWAWNITVSGFKISKNTITELPDNSTKFDVGTNLQTPNDFYNNEISKIQNLVFENKEQIFKNLPSDFAINNIFVEKSSIKLNNEKGTLTFTFSINKYYNNEGTLIIDTNSESRTIIITGFKTIKSSNNMSRIIGGVIAILGGVILIGVIVWLIMRNRKNN